MIVAVLLRGYKCYERSYFLPISQTPSFPYSAYVGQNGVGKSAVLESLDAFFDQREWNLNKSVKKDEAYVAPVFLIKKDTIRTNQRQRDLFERLTEYFVAADETINPQLKTKPFKDFFVFRDNLLSRLNIDEYYFFLLGKTFLHKAQPSFSTFDADLRKEVIQSGFDEQDLKNALKTILEHYAYVYIPVEGYVEDVLCLETMEMKELMSRDILDEIDQLLNKSLVIEERKVSVVRWINESLDKFMEEINETITGVDSAYTFKTDGGYKRNVTAQDVREQIIDAYFSIRTLKKNRKDISELSSGEQRQALIDIAYAFLSQRKPTARSVILAIDEPEVSLNVSKCLPQFDRLYKLVEEGCCQILFTTHWYGFLPATQAGTVHYTELTEEGVSFSSFEMPSLYDQKRRFPDDVELKSVFDFVSSVISLVRHNEINVLIVEGIEDYFYLRTHIPGNGIRIIPVGGSGNVIKVFNHLRPAFDDDKAVGKVRGKVFCLIDTDDHIVPFDGAANDRNGKVLLRRIQYQEGKIELLRPGSGGIHKKTVIEDAVDSALFFVSATSTINKLGSPEENHLVALYETKGTFKYALINHKETVFSPIGLDGYEQNGALLDCLEKYKVQIAKQYYEFSCLEFERPEWIGVLLESLTQA